jgi:hypothetical protein
MPSLEESVPGVAQRGAANWARRDLRSRWLSQQRQVENLSKRGENLRNSTPFGEEGSRLEGRFND